MADLTKYPLEDAFETTLAQSWNGTTGTMYLNEVPSFTFPAGATTFLVVNPGKSNQQLAEIDSIDTLNKTVNVTSITLEKGASVNYTTQTHGVNSIVRISDNYEFWKAIVSSINTKVNTDVTTTVADNIKIQFGGTDCYIFTDDGGTNLKFKDGSNTELSLSTIAAGGGADQKVAITTNDTTTGVLDDKLTVGDGLKKTVINPAGNESLDLDIDTTDSNLFTTTSSGSADEGKILLLNASGEVDDTALADIGTLNNTDYVAGEDISQGDSLLKYTGQVFGSVSDGQPVGNTDNNTRLAIRVVGSGTSNNQLKLALSKTGTPLDDLNIRIETDNSGEPSGTLIDANATGSISQSGLTTSLVDTTITLTDSIAIPLGTVAWIVLTSGTYGSETIQLANYYNVGYVDGVNDIVRYGRRYNGTSWEGTYTGTTVTDATGRAISSNTSTTDSRGFRIQANNDCFLSTVTLKTGCDATKIYLLNDGGSILATADVDTLVADFGGYKLDASTYYRLEADNDGSLYTSYFDTTTTFPLSNTNIDYVGSSVNGSNGPASNSYNIVSVDTIDYTEVGAFYISSSLIQTNLLIKTTALYLETLPDIIRISSANYNSGELVKYDFNGITKNISGLSDDTIYYISDTSGELSSSAGTNPMVVGKTLKSTDLQISGIGFVGEYDISEDTVYKASQNGIVVATYKGEDSSPTYVAEATIKGYLDDSDASTIIVSNSNNEQGPTAVYATVTFMVNRGKYYKISGNGGPDSSALHFAKFYPII